MFLLNSTKLVLTNTMMIGVIMTICSNNWISMWMGLEMVLLSFIPMMQTNKTLSSESMIKYFIIQSVASTLMLLTIMIMLIGVSMIVKETLIMCMTISMLIKIGSAPFHNWVIMIIETLNYNEIWVMLTLVKIPPLNILYQINSKFLLVPMLMGMMVSIFCLNQTSMRKTLGYSSIFNMALILSTMEKYNVMIIFMVIYSTMLKMITKMLNKTKTSFINQMVFNEKQSMVKMNIWINMLSMGGFPPMMGFMNKIMVIQMLIINNQYTLIMTVILTSMLVMMFYMRIAFTSMINISTSMKWMLKWENSYYNLMTNLIVFPMLISLTTVL